MKIDIRFRCRKCDRTVHYQQEGGKLPSVVKCEACGKQTAV